MTEKPRNETNVRRSPVSAAPRQPGGRAAAPGDLELVQSFVNSHWDLERGRAEQLRDPSDLARWLTRRDLLEPGTRLAEADLHRALEVREGLRMLSLVNNGAAADRGAIERLNRALPRAGIGVELDPVEPPALTARERDLDGALAALAAIVALAQLDGSWSRLKACRGVHCGWAFYDRSRNQSGAWCSMSVCGSRAKARDYRRRKKHAGAGSKPRPRRNQ